MGKKHRRTGGGGGGGSSSTSSSAQASQGAGDAGSPVQPPSLTLREWIQIERAGLAWVVSCALLGGLLGLGMGTGHLTGAAPWFAGLRGVPRAAPAPWRVALGRRIRASAPYEVMTLKRAPWDPLASAFLGTGGAGGGGRKSGGRRTVVSRLWRRLFGSGKRGGGGRGGRGGRYAVDSDEALRFAVLRESIVRAPDGFVHPDLGLMIPAPCGAARGIGMVRNEYMDCRYCENRTRPQIDKDFGPHGHLTRSNPTPSTRFDHMLIHVPLEVQLTRYTALNVLKPLVPQDIQRRVPLEELDDAALLVLQLAHERNRGRDSPHHAYVMSLPEDPPCGYAASHRAEAMDAVTTLGVELGVDVNGWPAEIVKAADYADRIADGLSRDYGAYLVSANPAGGPANSFEALRWALCHVTSRAIAGNSKHGSLRLVPLMDMVNHDSDMGKMIELTGKETYEDTKMLDAKESNAGDFALGSERHGRRKPLKLGQELLANYNVPGYSPLDWFLNLGFVPREKRGRWIKVDGALPKTRRSSQRSATGGSGGAPGAGLAGGVRVDTLPGIKVVRAQQGPRQDL